jgi:hypothetical protein
MPMASIQQPLTLSDLGIDLDEDSDDLHDEEVLTAVDTDNTADFEEKLTSYLLQEKEVGSFDSVLYERRVRTGIYYCRVSIGSKKQLFRMGWMRKS